MAVHQTNRVMLIAGKPAPTGDFVGHERCIRPDIQVA
jgi:hypothetical protein